MGRLCFTGRGSASLLVPGAAAQRRLPGRRGGGELAEWPPARPHQTAQPADTQQAAGTQTLAHHAAAHPGRRGHPLEHSQVQCFFISMDISQAGFTQNTQNPEKEVVC